MQVLSLKFLGIFLGAVVIATIYLRKKRGKSEPFREKQISLYGQRITTFMSRETPLACLLDEGKTYGENYKNKELPILPHSEGCVCKLSDIRESSGERFRKGKEKEAFISTDLGEITHTEFRFYKYALIAFNKDCNQPTKEEYLDLLAFIHIEDDFRKRVKSHLGVEL